MTRTGFSLRRLLVLTVALGSLALLQAATPPACAEWYDNYDFASKGVIAFWPFDGDGLDRSGQANHGSWSGSDTYEAGRFGSSHSLSPGTFLTAPTPTALASYSSITLAAWFKTTTVPSDNESLLGIGLDGAGPPHTYLFILGGGSINGLVFNAWSSTGAIGGPNQSAPQIYDGSWHLLTATWNGTESKLYIDSDLIAENLSATGVVTPPAGEPFYINRHSWGWGSSSRLTGAIDEPVIFDHALSAAEVAALASDSDFDGIADFWDGALYATQDSFLRQGAPDTNEGAADALRIQSSGKNRVLVAFDLSGIETTSVSSARLVLTISDLTDNWGSGGREVSAHRVLTAWSEGNGWTVGGNDRGSGPGVTWACPTDSEISNQRADCPGNEWAGGTFAVPTGPPVLHTNGMTGEVEFDVTLDVIQGAEHGWLLSKDLEGQNGKVHYYSREGAALAGNPDLGPRLVLTFE